MTLKTILGLILLLAMSHVVAAEPSAFIPRPAQVQSSEGWFEFSDQTQIHFTGATAPAEAIAADLRAATGHPLPLAKAVDASLKSSITLDLKPEQLKQFGEEGYALSVTPNQITITAATDAGLFYGGRTLLQCPARVPCMTVTDQPRFVWRGLMIDCSRTFQSLDYLRKTIDRMAAYKLNVLHLHLTDDEGWRVEIKKHPELTQKGAFFSAIANEPPERQGFYTQAQLRDLVAYAAARHITIVPEIEMPGHSHEVMVCYPHLSCAGPTSDLITPHVKGAKLTTDTFCAGKEETFAFLQDVMDEIADIFPSKFVHIGGDEAPKTAWKACPACQARMKAEGLKDEHELQSYFVRRMEKYLATKGRRLIGWDEILEGGLAPDATVMSWRGTKGGIAAASAGHDVVMTPTGYCYFDYAIQTTNSARVFSFDPVAGLDAAGARHVLGVQANFWSHLDRSPEHVDAQLFPRLLALAERAWSVDNRNDYADYLRRAQSHVARLKSMGVHVQPFDLVEPAGQWTPQSLAGQLNADGAATIELDVTALVRAPGDYLVGLGFVRGRSALKCLSAELVGVPGSRDAHEALARGVPPSPVYTLHVAALPSSTPIRLRLTLDPTSGKDTTGNIYLVPVGD